MTRTIWHLALLPTTLLAMTLLVVPPVHAAGKSVDVLVVDMGRKPFSEEARRLRTLVQVMAPEALVRTKHYRLVTDKLLARMKPRVLIIAPPAARWRDFPPSRIEKLRAAVRSFRGPVLGIGGGHQVVAQAWGGEIGPMVDEKGEWDEVRIHILKRDPIFDGVPDEFSAREGHREEVKSLPPHFELLASSEASEKQVIRHERRLIYGVQFHPEAPLGARLPAKEVLRNFLRLAKVRSVR